ncbi:MAG: hypothetical protein ACR2KP_04605 [Egibacteraceae bacterium]
MTVKTKFNRRVKGRGVCRRCDAPSAVRVEILATATGKTSKKYLGSRGGGFCDDHAAEVWDALEAELKRG